MKVRLTEVFDDGGDMLRIIVEDAETGEHVFDALWDPNEEQTTDNRQEFRRWVTRILARKGHESIN